MTADAVLTRAGRTSHKREAENEHDYYAMSVQEIAERLGVTPRRVDQIIQSALDRLRKRAQSAGLAP